MSTNVELQNVKPIPPDVNGSSTALGVKGHREEPIGHENIALDLSDEGPRQRKTPSNFVVSPDLTNEDEESKGNALTDLIRDSQTKIAELYKDWQPVFWNAFYVVLAILYFVYFGFAMAHSFGDEASIRLLVCTILGVIFVFGRLFFKHFGDKVKFSQFTNRFEQRRKEKCQRYSYYALVVACVLFAVLYIIIDIAVNTPKNLVSLTGMAFYIFMFFIFSYSPADIRWRPVFWGLIIQFFFGLMILRWTVGYQAFKWLGERVQEFLEHTDAGAKFVFGDTYTDHFFAFKVLTVIIFFSAAVSVLYYLEVMQFIIRYIARFMSWVLGTSPTESLNAAGNIFIGQSEAPLLIRPFIEDMTKSELHAVLTGGFATIAGSVMAAYISFNVPANHLLSASVMSAPAALAMSKLIYPETQKSKASAEKVYDMEKSPEKNIIEAASSGASQSISLIANIAVNLIAFIAALEFVNQTLRWFGDRVGLGPPDYEPLTFQFICSYVFYPLAAMMGADSVDCRKVAEMIGIKTFINEFVAYTQLSVQVNNVNNLTWYEGLAGTASPVVNGTSFNYTGQWHYVGNDIQYDDINVTLTNGIMTDRSIVISTYALCGFSNISSMGIMLGALGALAPSRKTDLSQIVFRAMIAGNVACFMTACIAGLLYEGEL